VPCEPHYSKPEPNRPIRPKHSRPRYNSTIEIKNSQIAGTGQGARGSYVLSGRVEPGGKLEWKSSGGDAGSFSAAVTGDGLAKG
jgi:hypothetical protein